MSIEVLFTRGNGIYVVRRGDVYYLLNLTDDGAPISSKYVDSFLKFSYFDEVESVEETVFEEIKKRIDAVV